MRNRMMKAAMAAAAGCAAAGPLCSAELPEYTEFQLQARANFSGAFNLPNSVFFNSATIALNDEGGVAMRVGPIGTGAGVWYGGEGMGTIVYTSPAEGVLSDVSLNTSGLMVVNQFFTSPTAIIGVDGETMMSMIRVAPGGFFGLVSLSSPVINDAGNVGFRGTQAIGGQAFISDVNGTQFRHVAEVGADPMSPYSFLFTPDFNNANQIAAKARRGVLNQVGESQPDEIRIWNQDGSSILIAEDQDSNPMSPYTRFDNSVSLTDSGWVAFTATLPGGARGVFKSNGVITHEIATTNHPDVSVIEFFRAVMNEDGLVAFRGRDGAGVETIFIGDGSELGVVVKRGDIVPSDLGDARIGQHDMSPAFGGSPAINASGDVAFNAGLTPPDNNQIEWGSGAYVALATAPGVVGDLDGDGVVSSSDLSILLGSWGACPPEPAPCAADLDGDGMVGSNDLSILLGSWG